MTETERTTFVLFNGFHVVGPKSHEKNVALIVAELEDNMRSTYEEILEHEGESAAMDARDQLAYEANSDLHIFGYSVVEPTETETFQRTNLSITKPYWAIVRYGDVNGYHTGVESDNIDLVQFDDVLELDQYLEYKTVESGESMGEFSFKILALYASHHRHSEFVRFAKEDLELAKMESESNE